MAETRAKFFDDLERRRLRSLVEPRLDDAERLHAPDYQLVTPGGRVLTRDEYLGGIASGELDYRVFEPASEVQVLDLGEAAAVRYLARIDIRFGGGGSDGGLFWHTDLYARRDGAWQAVWSQATEAAPASG